MGYHFLRRRASESTHLIGDDGRTALCGTAVAGRDEWQAWYSSGDPEKSVILCEVCRQRHRPELTGDEALAIIEQVAFKGENSNGNNN